MKGIYKYMDLKTGDVVYVGKDSHIDKHKRHNAHIAHSNYDRQPFNRILQNNHDKYEYSVLYLSDDVSDDDLNMLEMSFIERYNPKFNFTKGGDGSLDYKHSEESKMKISEAHNTSGYFRVIKKKEKKCEQGFRWIYKYLDENGKRKEISSVDIKKLEAKVKAKGLKWRRMENGGSSTKSLKK